MSDGDQLELLGRLVAALALGAAVGLEREYRGHEAGMRTNALVCAGAALFGELSRIHGDTRIAAAVVQGIGFLGAGLMIQRGHIVRGVTTAATIWAMAGVGLLVAESLWIVSIGTTAAIVVLLELSPLSDAVLHFGARHRPANPPKEDAPPPAPPAPAKNDGVGGQPG
jgi:putative Mg2+ transporter-C (MgtC) family protein